MEVNRLPRGLIVDLITPLKDAGELDFEGLDALLEKVKPHADGILLASPRMGEGTGLGSESKIALLKRAAASLRGELSIFFCVSEATAHDTQELLTQLEKALESSRYSGGVFWVDLPLFYHSNRGLYRHYQELTEIAAYPFILYNDPEIVKLLGKHLKRSNIRTDILKDLSSLTNIKGLIFRGSLGRANSYQKALTGRRDFKIYDGDETRFLEHPSSSGLLSIGANIAPRICGTITRASIGLFEEEAKGPDFIKRIWETSQLLRDLMGIYKQDPVPIIKKALFDMKVIASPACTKTTMPLKEDRGSLLEFISRHAID